KQLHHQALLIHHSVQQPHSQLNSHFILLYIFIMRCNSFISWYNTLINRCNTLTDWYLSSSVKHRQPFIYCNN
ncbi:unnamed protein product, partial [Coregonus sp. 'balchen']